MKPFDYSHAEQLIGKAVKLKKHGIISLITEVGRNTILIGNQSFDFSDLLEEFTFLDGTPCGVEEEYNLTFIEVLQTAKEGDSFKSSNLFEIIYNGNNFYYAIPPNNTKLPLTLSKSILNFKYKKL